MSDPLSARPTHSPLPWCVQDALHEEEIGIPGGFPRDIVRVGGTDGGDSPCSILDDLTAADAAFIVKAVNCHDALVAALSMLLADIQDYQRLNNLGGEDNHSQVMAQAALRHASGGE